MFGNIFNNDTPGQLYHIGANGLTCELIEPAASLKQYIHYYWVLKIDDGEVDLEVIPDAALDLVLSPHLSDFSCVYLPTTEKFNIPLVGPIAYAGISFDTQSALTLFATSVEQLQQLEQGHETTNALKLSNLVDAIQNTTASDAIQLTFDQFLTQGFSMLTTPLKEGILKKLVDHLEPISVNEIAKRVGMSERQFRRTTTSLTGLSPKQLQRIMRLQSVLHTLFDQQQNPELDAFYDDSHKIREIKQLTGLTPGQIRNLAEKYNR